MKSHILFYTFGFILLSNLLFKGIALGQNGTSAIEPVQKKSYSVGGWLSNYACNPSLVNTSSEVGAVLHFDYQSNPARRKALAYIDKRAVTSCAVFDFSAVNASSIRISYKSISVPIPGCTDGGNDGGGELEVFASADPSINADLTWKLVTVLPAAIEGNVIDVPVSPAQGTIRSVLVCRNGGAPERRDVLVRGISIAPSGDLRLSSAPSAPSPYKQKILEYAETAKNKIDAQRDIYVHGIWNTFYQTPSVYSLLSGWMIDQRPEWEASIRKQVNYSQTFRLLHGLPYINYHLYPNLYRDQIAREAIALIHVSQVLNDPQILQMADNIAKAMKNLLPRHQIFFKGRHYNLFYGEYSKTSPPISPLPNPQEDISPNQNAEVGLLFTMLYHEPRSSFYLTGDAYEIATHELDAAISVQGPNGELPLGVYPPGTPEVNDTGYASYTSALVAMANVYWNFARYHDFQYRIGRWFNEWRDPNHYAQHFANIAPSFTKCIGFDHVIDPINHPNVSVPCEYGVEMWQRIPALRQANFRLNNFSTYTPKLYSDWLSHTDTLNDGRVIFLQFADVPLNYYLPNPQSVSISVYPESVTFGAPAVLKWSAPASMQKCEIRATIPGIVNNELWDTARSGQYTIQSVKWNISYRLNCLDASGFSHSVTATVKPI